MTLLIEAPPRLAVKLFLFVWLLLMPLLLLLVEFVCVVVLLLLPVLTPGPSAVVVEEGRVF